MAASRQAIDSFCDGGLEPPKSLVDSLSSLSRELVDARRISSDLHGAIRPPSQRPGVSSHRQRFAAALPGMGTQSQLSTIRLNELQTIGYQICPDVGERCCGAGENLVECLGVLQFPVEDDDGLIPLFW